MREIEFIFDESFVEGCNPGLGVSDCDDLELVIIAFPDHIELNLKHKVVYSTIWIKLI